MKFYQPKFQIAALKGPQRKLRSKFGGLPWGLPLERWSRCQSCGRLMSLLGQLCHNPPALDLGGSKHVLHLFQCQECFGYESGKGNDAVMIPVRELGPKITPLPEAEDLHGLLGSDSDRLVGELWIEGWKKVEDGLDPIPAKDAYNERKWLDLPEAVANSMFDIRWRTKMGGIPYWTGNGPNLFKPRKGYEFLFQLNNSIEFSGSPPNKQEWNGKVNAPWDLSVYKSATPRFVIEITNLGTDGTAYFFINRGYKPAKVYWFWNR